MKKRVMFYVQHLLGIGHLARASLICHSLKKQGFEVRMVMGGTPVKGFPGAGIKVEHLPVLKAGCFEFNSLTDENGVLADQQYLDNRRDLLLASFQAFKPDILIIEAFPFGRRQMRFELIPLLEAAKSASWKPLLAGSVRDIVQEKKKTKRLRETVDTVKKYYDLLMVHGDPDFVKLGETFEPAREIDHLIKYTGIVSAKIPPLTGPQFDVVVSAGGGAAGELIMLTAIQARPLTSLRKASWCFITGPNMSAQARQVLDRYQTDGVTIETHRTDFRALLSKARLSISQAGYNTTADILRAGCASVLVPFAAGGETEQTRRAHRLGELGLAKFVGEKGLTPKALAAVIDNAERGIGKFDHKHLPALNGSEQSAKILHSLIKTR